MFISEKANAVDRLISALQPIMSSNSVIQYHAPDTFGRVVSPVSKEPAVAVIMVRDKEELALLSEREGIWNRFKTILVIQDDDQETINLGLSLHPIFITYMDSDFSEVADIIDHIKNRAELDFQNPDRVKVQ
jgi:hypothetical protein